MMTANYNERRAAQKELEGQLRTSLGEARYADYIRETSDDFQQLRRMAQRDNIPIEVATRAFDLRTGVAADSVRIINDSVMTVDQKREAMVALAQGTRTQLLGLLGSTTGPAYIKLVDNAWLNNIERGIAIEFTGGPRSTMSSGGVTVGVGTSAAAVRGLPMVRPTP